MVIERPLVKIGILNWLNEFEHKVLISQNLRSVGARHGNMEVKMWRKQFKTQPLPFSFSKECRRVLYRKTQSN